MDKARSVLKVVLRNSSGESITVSIHPDDTIQDLKNRIHSEAGIHIDFNRMNSNGQKVTDDQNVVDYISSGLNSSLAVGFAKNGGSDNAPRLTCIVPGCASTKLACFEKTLCTSPTLKDKRHQWITLFKHEDLIDNVEFSLTVCSDHFIEEQFMSSFSNRLKEDTQPTMFPVVQPAFNKSSMFSTQEHEAIFTDNCETVIKTESDTDSNLDVFTGEDKWAPLEHPGQLCRLCATSTLDVIYIFSSTGKQLNIADKINSSLPVLVQQTDPLPKQLCSSCVVKLNMCYEFSQSCIEAEEKLKSLTKLKQF